MALYQSQQVHTLSEVDLFSSFCSHIISFFPFIHRLLEESRINRLRLEAAKANSNAVVRQQVFYFDPNYRDQLPGQDGAAPQGQVQAQAAPSEPYYDSNSSMVDDQGSVGNQRRFPQQGVNPIGVSARPLMVANNRGRVAPAPHVRYASTGNMNTGVSAATAAHNAGTSNHSQEELLRQLFPSWF